MAFPKPEHFSIPDQRIGAAGRILGHPARSQILKLLASRGALHFYEIAQMLPLCDGTVTEHVRKLRAAGLLEVRVIGLTNCYSLNPDRVRRMQEDLNVLMNTLLEPNDTERDLSLIQEEVALIERRASRGQESKVNQRSSGPQIL